MIDQPSVHVAENSPEFVAFRLLERIAMVENRGFNAGGADRNWILDTYAECLMVVQNPSARVRTIPEITLARSGEHDDNRPRVGDSVRRHVAPEASEYSESLQTGTSDVAQRR
jgi:hypothetical protein